MSKKNLIKLLTCFFVQFLQAGVWNIDASADWEIASNWSTGVVPNSPTATASFGNIITEARTISINSANEVQSLTFNSPFSYTLATTGSDLTVGDTITFTSGSHTISLDLLFGGNMTINQNSTENSFFQGNVTGTNLVFQGSTNTVQTSFSAFVDISTAINIDNTGVILEQGSSLITPAPISLANGGVLIARQDMTIANPITVTTGPGIFDVAAGNNATLTGALSTNPAGNLNFSGPGTITIAVANTIDGNVNLINQSIVALQDDLALGTSSVTLSANSTLTNSGTRTLNNQLAVIDTGTISASTATDFILNGNIISAGTVTFAGAGTKVINNNNLLTEEVILTEGITRLGDDNAFGTSRLVLNGGILEATSDYTIANRISVDSSSAINTSAGATFTLDGVISGNGNLALDGPGTTIFTQANMYTGLTNIFSGTIIAENDAAFGIGQVTLLTVNFTTDAADHTFGNDFVIIGATSIIPSAANTLTINGVLSGPGDLTIPSGRVLVLSGDNTLSGTVLLQNDNITIQNSDAFGTATVTFDGANLTTITPLSLANEFVLNQDTTINPLTDDLALTGNITGTGALSVSGTAGSLQTLTLTGTNTYTNSVFTDLTTSITNDNALGTGTLTLNSSILNVDGSLSSTRNMTLNTTTGTEKSGITVRANHLFTPTGTLTGTDGFIKSGLGELLIANDQLAISGDIAVIEGTFTINSALTNANLVGASSCVITGNGSAKDATMNGGLLKGNGSYASITMNSGMIAPGNSIGTITVTGNYVQNADSTYQVEIDGNTSDQIVVTGNATIQNGAILTVLEPIGIVIKGTTYDILIANAIDQPWSVVNLPNTVELSLQLVETNTIARLTALSSAAFLQQPIDSGNPMTIANYINTLDFSSDTDLIAIITSIDANPDKINQALNQLHHARFASFEITNVESNFGIISTIDQHNSYFGCLRDCDTTPGSIWVAMLGSMASRKLRKQVRGSNNKDLGAIIGYDYCARKNIVLGASGGYLNTDLKWDERGGSATVQKGFGTVHGTYNDKHLQAILCLMAGANFYNIDRRIAFLNIDRTANSSNIGGFFTSNFGGKVDLFGTPNTIIAQGNIGYHYLCQPSFEETGANGINLDIDSRRSHFLRSQLGLQLSGKANSSQNCIRYYVGGNWINKNLLNDATFSGKFLSFEEKATSFTVIANNKAINGFLAEAGIEVSTKKNRILLAYEGEFSEKDQNHRFQGSLGWFF